MLERYTTSAKINSWYMANSRTERTTSNVDTHLQYTANVRANIALAGLARRSSFVL